ncbi:hypothetical protein EDD37DRAFT_634802 [Exophiala viscosa]|uniref:uncharacterized protein n=1 Tax=Exophiala viscosa TaxID=2486360 RepID=UPI0021972859|nr:hypothetical protein EDD37DRAFT_634802 [Exophiala viscosa]
MLQAPVLILIWTSSAPLCCRNTHNPTRAARQHVRKRFFIAPHHQGPMACSPAGATVNPAGLPCFERLVVIIRKVRECTRVR